MKPGDLIVLKTETILWKNMCVGTRDDGLDLGLMSKDDVGLVIQSVGSSQFNNEEQLLIFVDNRLGWTTRQMLRCVKKTH